MGLLGGVLIVVLAVLTIVATVGVVAARSGGRGLSDASVPPACE
ncbi:hypothetical protein RCH23_002887 [Cryobacterium sp. CAN_C3]|nr:hypothetical protein [Cryobacterium sp. CAN_C3]